MPSLVVKMRQNVKLMGTSLELKRHHVYRASYATNQPDWESKRLEFVYPSNDVESDDSILCSLWSECEGFRTQWCVIDGNRGIYGPRDFCEVYIDALQQSVALGEISEDDLLTVLSGPDNPEYWEAWDEIVTHAVIVDAWPDGVKIPWGIYEDGDIFLQHELHEWEGESE